MLDAHATSSNSINRLYRRVFSSALAAVILATPQLLPLSIGSAAYAESTSDGSIDPKPVPLRGPIDQNVRNKLDDIVKQAEDSEGAMFVGSDKVAVKAPVLSALITLDQNLSPYGIDASGNGRAITLRDVLTCELANNLDIKISQSDEQSMRWNYRSVLGGYLPSLTNQVTYQGITGKYASPFGALANVGSNYLTIPSALTWNFFDGGHTIFGSRQAKQLYKAASSEVQQTTNDMLLEGVHLYYQLVLQDVLLQIRVKAVETSQALYDKNAIQFKYGANTKLDLLQAETQLANDKQALISQQIARRKAAVKLATNLNLNCDEDLLVSNKLVETARLVSANAKVSDLVQVAIDNRPELKKYEQQRLAAKEAIRVAYAPLLPQISGSIGLATTGAKAAPISGGANASSASTGSFGAGGFTTGSVSAVGSSGATKSFSLAEIYIIGLAVNWNIGGLGLTDYSKIQAAKSQARRAQLEFARQLALVCKNVRDSYLESLDAQNLIGASTAAVNSSRQQLRVAISRLEEGVGTDLDVVNAQRDYTNALIAKANAIVQFNESQAFLLRAMGRISVDTLTSGRTIAR